MTADCQILTGNPSSAVSHMSVLVFLRKILVVHGLFFFSFLTFKVFLEERDLLIQGKYPSQNSKGFLLYNVWPLVFRTAFVSSMLPKTSKAKHFALGHFLFFLLQFPDYLPCSVCLQPAPRDVDKVRPVGHLCLSWLMKSQMEKNHVNLFSLRVGQGDTDFTVLCHECQELRATNTSHRTGVEILKIRKGIQTNSSKTTKSAVL